jgi:hypothetical protein
MTTRFFSSNRRQRAKIGGLALWTAIVSIFFLWQLVQYRGIVAFIAEWQFSVFGHSLPVISYLLPVVVLVSPGLLLFWRARPRQSEERLAGAMIRSAQRFQQMLFAVAASFGVGALVFLVVALNVPANQDQALRIDLAKPMLAQPADGQTTITGSILYNQTVALEQNLFITRTAKRFAPIVAPGAAGNDLQYFVELPTPIQGESLPQISSRSGILQRDALPGELVRLYRYAGFRVEQPYYVLFLDKSTIAFPKLKIAVELLIMAAIFAVLGLLQRRRIKRLETDINEQRPADLNI